MTKQKIIDPDLVKRILTREDYNQSKLAETVGVKQSSVSRWKNGEPIDKSHHITLKSLDMPNSSRLLIDLHGGLEVKTIATALHYVCQEVSKLKMAENQFDDFINEEFSSDQFWSDLAEEFMKSLNLDHLLNSHCRIQLPNFADNERDEKNGQ